MVLCFLAQKPSYNFSQELADKVDFQLEFEAGETTLLLSFEKETKDNHFYKLIFLLVNIF